jgi:dihydrofolate reductase/thymidylate synthase
MLPRLTLVFATDKNGLFGLNNQIPWRCSEDLKHFNRVTSDTFSEPLLVMGRKTFESLPKKLEGRKHIVLSSKEVPGADYTSGNFEHVLNVYSGKHLFIIGGAALIEEVYTKYRTLIDTIYYTKINQDIQVPHTATHCTRMFKSVLDTMLCYPHVKKESSEATFYKISLPKHEEYQYLELLQNSIETGSYRQTRNAATFSSFNKTITFDLTNGFPLLTTKKVFMRGIFEELMFFLKGKTDSKELESKGVNIWKPNTTQEFIQSCGLPYEEGDMGPMYGWNWKHFGAEYVDKTTNYEGKGFNQIEYAMSLLKNDPFSRRILMTTYNPATAKKGVLYPCHSLVIQFYVKEISGNFFVSMNMYQRSVDLACGLPFNIASNALLLHLICETLNAQLYHENGEKHTARQYIPYKMNIILGDIHVYEQHVEGVRQQIQRIPFSFPKLRILQSSTSIEDYTFDDISIENYICHPAIKYEMIA